MKIFIELILHPDKDNKFLDNMYVLDIKYH